MGLRIQNNIAAMNAHRNLQISDSAMSKSLERLSSGYRINKASDDAAGLAVSSGMRADIASYKVASRNTTEASALLQVAEGAYDQIGNILTRMKELATQGASANAAGNAIDIQNEVTTLKGELDRIAGSTRYNGTVLLDGTYTGKNFIVGTESTDVISVGIDQVDSATLGLAAVTGTVAADLDTIGAAISTLATSRAEIGATMNRLGYAAANLASTIENTQAAESVIRDVDMAAEMTTFSKNQILLQAGTAMLAQANMAPQGVLSLFQ